MALDNIVQLVTDVYKPEVIDTVVSSNGLDAFKGDIPSYTDFTGTAWALYALTSAVSKNPGSQQQLVTHFKSVFTRDMILEKSQTGFNAPSANLLAYAGNRDVDASIVYSVTKEVCGDDSTFYAAITDKSHSDFTATMILYGNAEYLKKVDDLENLPDNIVKDENYADSGIMAPIGRAVLAALKDESLMGKVKNIIQKYGVGKFGKKFNDPKNNSFFDVAYQVRKDGLSKLIENEMHDFFISGYNKGASVSLSDIDQSGLDNIVSAIDFSKCTGLKFGETGFRLSSYSSNTDIGSNFALIDIYRGELPQEAWKYIDQPFCFPVPEDGQVDGYTPLAYASYFLQTDDDGFKQGGLLSFVKTKLSEVSSVVGGTDIERLYKANAILGSARDFSMGANGNMYGTLNIIFTKINAQQRSVRADGQKIEDLENVYNTMATQVGISFLSFEAYLRWCDEYGKRF